MMDAVSDPLVRQVTIMKSARIGYTKCLDNIVGYYIAQDPSPILVVQPRVEDADDYSRTEIVPMLRDTPVLMKIIGEWKAKDPDQRIAKRMFRNGASVAFVGANSPGGFRRITARIVAFDEVDGYAIEGAGQEGDQIALGTKRTESFWNRKIILGSTPTIKGSSRIEKAFAESDQRYYFVPCPHCGHFQTLRWENMHWDKDVNDQGHKIHRPETAHFVCEAAGCVMEEHDKPRMVREGKWVGSKPFKGHAGFHIWAAYSLFPNACWGNLATEFLRTKGDIVQFRTFVNTVWGQTWEEATETLDATGLITRGESYGPGSLPDRINFITVGVDVQGDRLEVQMVGWGPMEESWVVDYEILYGDPSQQTVWMELDKVLLRTYQTETRREIKIRGVCVDTGGHQQNQVIQFCKRRWARRIFPIQGFGGNRQIWPRKVSQTTQRQPFFAIGVDTAKDTLYGRLRITKPGPGYVHFPVGEKFDQDYFDQLTSEKVVTRQRMGRPYRVWELPPNKRNEALDTFVYALAARMSMSDATSTSSQPVSIDMPAGGGGAVVVPQKEIEDALGIVRPKRSLAKLLPR